MKRNFASFVFKLLGWQVINHTPPELKKYVVMMAPHTSNWDFVLGWIGYRALGISSSYLIKKEAFAFPLGVLLKSLGGIPVDRKSSTNIVFQVAEMFKKTDSLVITITPEGSRSLRRNWKRGFYHIAVNAGVPIALGFLDYKKKIGGIGEIIYPSGDYEKDFEQIKAFYTDKTGRYPENFNLSPQNINS